MKSSNHGMIKPWNGSAIELIGAGNSGTLQKHRWKICAIVVVQYSNTFEYCIDKKTKIFYNDKEGGHL